MGVVNAKVGVASKISHAFITEEVGHVTSQCYGSSRVLYKTWEWLVVDHAFLHCLKAALGTEVSELS